MYLQVFLNNSMRVLFITSAALIALAFTEWAAQLAGTTLVGRWYSPGRLLEIAATMLVYVIAVYLREIRDVLRANRT
jgi:hypothetical protein